MHTPNQPNSFITTPLMGCMFRYLCMYACTLCSLRKYMCACMHVSHIVYIILCRITDACTIVRMKVYMYLCMTCMCMHLRLCIYRSLYISDYLSVSLCVGLSVRLSVCLSDGDLVCCCCSTRQSVSLV